MVFFGSKLKKKKIKFDKSKLEKFGFDWLKLKTKLEKNIGGFLMYLFFKTIP